MMTRSFRATVLASLAGALIGAPATPAFAIGIYNGHPPTMLDACSYYNDFNAGGPAADMDDGSATGTLDGAVGIEDLLYFMSAVQANTLNDSCATPIDLTPYAPSGYGQFVYWACLPNGIGQLVSTPTAGAQGQSNRGGGRCNGVAYSTAIPNDMWYRWTAPPGAGLTLINTVGFGTPLTTDDTRLAVYGFAAPNTSIPNCPAGNTCPSGGGVRALGYNDDSSGIASRQSRIAFRAIPGNTYLIQLGGIAPCAANVTVPECRTFEIVNMNTAAHNTAAYTSPGFPALAGSYRITTEPPIPGFAPTTLPVSAATCTAALPCVGPASPRRCIDLVPNMAYPTSTHIVLELRYAGLLPPQRCGLRLGHRPSTGPNAGIWVNARCANTITGPSPMITGVVDNLSPFALVDEGCPADVTGDGGVGIEDLLYYLELFNAGDDGADMDLDGGVGIEDLLDYLARYNQGC